MVVSVNDRIDAFNFGQLKVQVNQLIDAGELFLVVDLEATHFLSLPTIKFLAEAAKRLATRGGSLALLTPAEKLKRQIHIYATLEEMKLFRSREDLERTGGEPEPFGQQLSRDKSEDDSNISDSL